MKIIKCVFACLFLAANLNAAKIAPKEALQRLVDGNQRFLNDELTHPDRTEDRRLATSSAQTPFAVILGCADSRIPPEIVFDQGIGDLFVVRVAGNVLGPLELDSIEYSVLVNGSSLVVVLGHENCGAVKAVLEKQTKDIESVAELIEPCIRNSNGQNGDRLASAIKSNVQCVVGQLKRSPVLKRYIEQGNLDVVGGYYNLKTGKVDLLK